MSHTHKCRAWRTLLRAGGERKRVSIGAELLINPSVLFMDEVRTRACAGGNHEEHGVEANGTSHLWCQACHMPPHFDLHSLQRKMARTHVCSLSQVPRFVVLLLKYAKPQNNKSRHLRMTANTSLPITIHFLQRGQTTTSYSIFMLWEYHSVFSKRSYSIFMLWY